MLQKIVILCVNPWDGLLSPIFQSCGREYFHWICKQAFLKNIPLISKERIEIYGELQGEEALFVNTENKLQLLYVQSHSKKLLKEVFDEADLVVMGVPGSLKDFEKMFIAVFPWKDQILFLWEKYLCRDEKFLQQLCRNYKIRESQMFELKRDFNGKLSDI